MERPVEIARNYADCKKCMDMADMCDQIPDCDLCKKHKGTLVDAITNMFGTKAVVVLEDGKVEAYTLDRLKNITKRER